MKVGDKLYFVYSGNCPRPSVVVDVFKVGRVWGHLSNGYRIDLKTLRADAGQYSSPGRAWNSKVEHDEKVARDKLWLLFRILVSAVRVDNDLTIEQIVKAADALGIDLDPKGKK